VWPYNNPYAFLAEGFIFLNHKTKLAISRKFAFFPFTVAVEFEMIALATLARRFFPSRTIGTGAMV
jgi:hypothetical protein